ncbi:MAG: hypothetical protein J0M00_09075 [Burkholderiales bacterium]|nr:hypothetical protein [Burkholderiales bacterium]
MADDERTAPLPERGDPSWVAPALTPEAVTRRVGKTPVFFGPPLARLTESGRHTMEISGILNRTAERYLALRQHHGLDLSEAERQCVAHVCGIGYLSPLEITELGLEVRLTNFECEGLDKAALADRLDAAPFVDLLMLVESLGF